MSTISRQLETLTTIRNLIEKHFPKADFYYIQEELKEYIDIEPQQEIRFDEAKHAYILHNAAFCKICGSIDNLIEIPTATGHFHICRKCQHKIVTSGTLAANIGA